MRSKGRDKENKDKDQRKIEIERRWMEFLRENTKQNTEKEKEEKNKGKCEVKDHREEGELREVRKEHVGQEDIKRSGEDQQAVDMVIEENSGKEMINKNAVGNVEPQGSGIEAEQHQTPESSSMKGDKKQGRRVLRTSQVSLRDITNRESVGGKEGKESYLNISKVLTQWRRIQ